MIVDELKKAILQYAVQGKLTKQLDSDSNTDKLLTDKIDYTNLDNDIFIPSNWKLIKLSNIAKVYGGKRVPAGRRLSDDNTGYKYIRVADMKNGTINITGIKYISEDIFCLIKNYFISSDDLYITVAGTIGAVGMIPEELSGSNLTENANKIVFNTVNKKWLYYFLTSNFVQKQIVEFTTKVGQPKLAIKRINSIVTLLPPIEEQQRIVDKIDELFSKLDELKDIETELNNIKGNFPNEIRNSVLQCAIEGNLTERDINDSLIKETFHKLIFLESTKEVPFMIPKEWKWIKFKDLVDYNMGKTPPRKDPIYWAENFSWISIADMISDGYIKSTKEKVSDLAIKEIFKEKISKKGTLIMSFKLTVGRVSILDIDAVHNEAIISIYPKFDKDNIVKNYLFKILPIVVKYGNTKGAIKGSTLNSKSIDNLLIPLPPIEEQQRIVDKLEQILPLIDNMQFKRGL